MESKNRGLINNLRLGTAILFGVEGIYEDPIPNLYQDSFTFIAEIVEIKEKPVYPKGTITTNAYGEPSIFLNKKPNGKEVRIQALLNVGRQDVIEKKLIPKDDIEIMSATSDYIIVDLKKNSKNFKLGDELRFDLDYEALLHLMTSPYISKVFI